MWCRQSSHLDFGHHNFPRCCNVPLELSGKGVRTGGFWSLSKYWCPFAWCSLPACLHYVPSNSLRGLVLLSNEMSCVLPSHDLQRALQFTVQPPSLLVEHRVKEAHGTREGDFCWQDRQGFVRGDLPQATKGMVELASSGHICSLQARKKVLKCRALKSYSWPTPCSPPLSVPLHLICCGLRIQHIDKMP